MPINKNASYRYRLIDSCLSQKYKKWKYKDLLAHVSEKVAEEFDIEKGISKRQFDYDIQLMRKDAPEGFGAPIVRMNEKIYYEDPNFSILNQPLREDEKAQLYEALGVLGRFEGMPQFEWMEDIRTKLGLGLESLKAELVQFESNPYLEGREYLSSLFEHIRQQNTIEISYQSFRSESVESFPFSPYLLKEYNNRWFLFGHREGIDILYNVPLDRIKKIANSDCPFIENDLLDFNDYFEDVIGVSVMQGKAIEKVVLCISSQHYPYVKTKPLHGSQKEIEVNDTTAIISIEVIPNFELEKKIFAMSDDVEILKPAWFREKIKNRIENLWERYR